MAIIDTPQILIDVPKEEVPFVVPFESYTGYVGEECVRAIARLNNGEFRRDIPGIGLVENMDLYAGPSFDPTKVHPLIRQFYEHTCDFHLEIVPEWKKLYLPAFWLFRKLLGERIGQFNLPFDMKEAQRGMISHIDTIDFDHDDKIDFRAWVRTYRDSDLPIYVAIYSHVSLLGTTYISVGFPLPNGNITVNLVPSNINGSDFVLSTHYSGAPFAGIYYAHLNSNNNISAARLINFHEDIEVFVREDTLLADHHFIYFDQHFLTLHYTMTLR